MDTSTWQGIVGWIIGIGASSVIAIIVGIISIIRSGKMLPKDLKGADLGNEEKEANLAKTYKMIATEAAQEALEINKRVSVLEEQVHKQSVVIMEQAETIRLQGERITAQDEIIETLECKLSNSEEYNRILIEQMQREKITPTPKINLRLKDCNKNKNKKSEA